MTIDARCKTTAMGIMPHTDIDRALELALGLDIPFFPQLPKVDFHEDMYAQASQNFPGIKVDLSHERVDFNSERFNRELTDYMERMADAETFDLTSEYSVVYHRFLEKDLGSYEAIRGQLTGPVSFGFKVVDESKKPIIYDDEIRTILFDFLQRKANVQYQQLNQKNRNAFVWLDEPGLGWVFSGLSGYLDEQAKQEYRGFLEGLEGPKALHLCANVNLPYLLSLGLDILSFDAYQIEVMPRGYAQAVVDFIEAGGILCWGIVPTDSTSLGAETPDSLAKRLIDYWGVVSHNSDITPQRIAHQSLIAPARCCLKNIGLVGAAGENGARSGESCQLSSIEEELVDKAFACIKEVSSILRGKYNV
jgi:hypothetical protein